MKNTLNKISKKMKYHIQQPVIWKQPTCETFISFRTYQFWKYQQKGFNISFILPQYLSRSFVKISKKKKKKKIQKAVVSLTRNFRS